MDIVFGIYVLGVVVSLLLLVPASLNLHDKPFALAGDCLLAVCWPAVLLGLVAEKFQ